MKYNSNRLKKDVLVLAVILILAVFPMEALASGNDNPAQNNEIGAQLEEDMRSGELTNFINSVFSNNMEEYNIPGAAVSIVKDGKTIFSKGYGYSNIKSKEPVDPAKTLFRIGSVTKLFTATAVMQLAQEGKIDLNTDVNEYLNSLRIKDRYREPVTMDTLLTHTSGIDSDEIGDLTTDGSAAQSLDRILGMRMLPVVREPGTFIQYSSYGMALAGCIAENVSGMRCNDYISQNILEPLCMTNTSFALDIDGLAQGYNAIDGQLEAKNLTGYFKLYPIGGIVSTADDMAKFMIAHLNDGEYNGKQILDPQTAQEMHSRHAGFDPLLPGTCFGFYERFLDGQRSIDHAGYSEDGFSTEMTLFPQYHLGIFVCVNQGSNNSFPQDFSEEFIGRYYPGNTEDVSGSANAEESIDKSIAGTYRFGEYTRSTIAKADIFGVGQDTTVTVNDDGSITLDETDPFTMERSVLNAKPISSLTFRKTDGDYIVFKKDNNGKIAYMAQTSDSWHGTYEKISWYDQNSFQIGLFIILMGLSLFETVVWLIYLMHRFLSRKKPAAPKSKAFSFSSHSAGICTLLNFSFFAVSLMTWGTRLRYGVPLDIFLLLIIPNATSILTIIYVIVLIVKRKSKEPGRFFRINSVLAASIGIAFIWLYSYWNFIGFRF